MESETGERNMTTKSYNDQVREYLAEQGFAPALSFYEKDLCGYDERTGVRPYDCAAQIIANRQDEAEVPNVFGDVEYAKAKASGEHEQEYNAELVARYKAGLPLTKKDKQDARKLLRAMTAKGE